MQKQRKNVIIVRNAFQIALEVNDFENYLNILISTFSKS